ncbi:hypothetical protein THRCLA_02920 [Thraustotheca clavata]|uniref:AB hydrolase-1 domain-containing protein n=1 Tax=Thraustotheca clavata TaxID=74557 RepID=A0A1W0A4A5_9STRA|nr:hypothetical protein THRCLA_02920 [Thraustotheca clavata]
MNTTLAHTIVGGSFLDKNKKTIFILHGILVNKDNWSSFCQEIVNKYPNWQVVAIDLRAHGDSPSFNPPHNLASCAQDVINLSEKLGVTPDVVVGHSFGGKVALAYLDACRQQNRPTPKDTWVLEALPGCGEIPIVTDYILPTLLSLPVPIASKREFVALLESKGFETRQAQWMTTNLKSLENDPEQFEWKMNLAVIQVMFQAFLATDCWPILYDPPLNTSIHIVQAEYNQLWTEEILTRFRQLPTRDRVHLHLLEKSDHWVHIDNPNGLFAMMEKSLQ